MHSSGEIGPDLSERLISGNATQPALLVALLAAASAPGTPDELAGEEAALLAFRQARPAPAAQTRRRAAGRAWSGRLGVRVALLTAAAAVVALGLGTVTGVIPDVTGLVPSGDFSSTLDAPNGRPAHPTTTGSAASTADPRLSGSSAATPGPAASALPGLCRAYRAQAANNPGHELDNPSFAALVTAAGGREAVPAYCDTLIGPEDPEKSRKPKPESTGTRSRSGSAA